MDFSWDLEQGIYVQAYGAGRSKIESYASSSLCQAAWTFFGVVTCFTTCVAISSAVRPTQFTTSLGSSFNKSSARSVKAQLWRIKVYLLVLKHYGLIFASWFWGKKVACTQEWMNSDEQLYQRFRSSQHALNRAKAFALLGVLFLLGWIRLFRFQAESLDVVVQCIFQLVAALQVYIFRAGRGNMQQNTILALQTLEVLIQLALRFPFVVQDRAHSSERQTLLDGKHLFVDILLVCLIKGKHH